jgi:drug/metabolite transporter (DMT)-like permease
VSLARLTRGHVVAAVAALALLLVMAMNWYGSTDADFARKAAAAANPTGATAGEVGRELRDEADQIIARDEKNPWHETAAIDRLLLVLLLLTVALPLVAAALRADGRRFEPPFTPAAFAAVSAVLAALLLAYRLVQEPGPDSHTTIKPGALIGLGLLAVVGLGSAYAFQREADWTQMRRVARAQAGARDAADVGADAAGDSGNEQSPDG